MRGDRGRGRTSSSSSSSSNGSDVSLVGLAAAAAAGSAASRYAEAKTILGSMTGTWAEERETKRRVKKTEIKGGKGVNGVSAAGETTTASYERRHAAAGTGTRDGRGTKARGRGGGFGPNPYATLEKKSTEVLFENEVVALATEVSRERERAVRDMRAKGMARRDASAEERGALRRAEEELRRAKAEQKRAEEDARRQAAMEKKRAKKAAKKSNDSVERAQVKDKDKGKPEETPKRGGGVAGVVVEIGKFALPAVIAWFARQPTINELRLNLEAMTAAKARADEEASKIRAKLVELRNKLALAEKAVADQKTAAETLMNRRNSVKEVKMKQMSVDHNGQMKKVREDAAKEIQVAKSLEVGARWREEACRRMKNRAEADAEGLREKINQLEAELERVKAAGEEDNPVAKVQHTVGNAVQRVASLARSASKLGRPKAKDDATSSKSAIPKPKKTIPKPRPVNPAAGAFGKVTTLVRSVSKLKKKNAAAAPAKQ